MGGAPKLIAQDIHAGRIMSFMNWLSGLFGPKSDDDVEEGELESSPFEISQHGRIVLALLVVALSGCVMWWILE